ncbi:OmpH family outer membrane protein [Tabrizicola sp.]|uniref:OmpH family outer membrane protein n=1 Tax=Tabrizicola sp. TaxID=2005166 RepID=UPI00273594C0|nr:OmpH family outer membrane protein [Tabrizicola sp.]MDP3649356.1 OmpH family outer membrane protein [Paracoccaceae bacterium]
MARAACSPALRAAVLALFLGLAPLGAMAQDAAPDAVPESAVLTLDQDRLFAESAFGKAAIAREAEAVSALAAENLRIEKELEAEERALTARRPNTPKEEFASLAAAFDTKVERIRTEQDAKSRDIARARDVDRQRFLQSAVPVLGDLLADQSAVAIIDKGAIILSLSAIDVTDLAIQRVDSVLGDGSAPPLATAPQPAP